MRKTGFRKVFGAAGLGIAAALMATNPQAKAMAGDAKVILETKAVTEHMRKRVKVVHEIGGLTLETLVSDYGMSPKQYGILFGHGGSRKAKTNFRRLAHNAKLKRR